MMRPLLLDSNLLVLLIVGSTRRDYIARHRRLKAYDAVDYDILLRFVEGSSGLISTPNVLTETGNLLAYTDRATIFALRNTFAALVANTDERFIASRFAVGRPEFPRLGLTDTVLSAVAQEGARLLTVDVALYLAACRAGADAINFNHERDRRLDFQ